MEELSILARFLDKFLKGLAPSAKEKLFHVCLLIGTLVYQRFHGRLSLDAWRENVWEAVTPWILVLWGLCAYHIVKAALSLNNEVQRGLSKAKKPFIILTDGEPRRVTPSFQYKISGIVFASIATLSLLPYLSWSAARSVTHDGIFSVSPGLTFINMAHSVFVGFWWVTYRSPLGDTVSPVALTQYVSITNLQSIPETIKSYSVAIKTEDCGWTYLYPIRLGTVTVWSSTIDLENAIKIDFNTNGLDYILEKPIPSYGTVGGFWFFDSGVKCDVPDGSKVQYRISLATFDSKKFEYTTPEITVRNNQPEVNSFEAPVTGPQFIVPPNAKQDISRFARAFYGPPGIRIKPN